MNADAIVRQVIDLGRQTDEPTHVIPRTAGRTLGNWLFGIKARRPLADPRLEVLRALSSAIDKAPAKVDPDLVEEARRSGWTQADLHLFFPTFPWSRITAFRSLGAAA